MRLGVNESARQHKRKKSNNREFKFRPKLDIHLY